MIKKHFACKTLTHTRIWYAYTEQTATALQLVTATSDIKPKQSANFPIEDKIVLQALDASGERVYSGSDSILVSKKTTFKQIIYPKASKM